MTSDPAKQLDSLGYPRLRLFRCLGGDRPRLPQYLELAPGEDALLAFQRFVEDMIQRCRADEDRVTRALIGAARLLVGELAGADEILDHLPAARIELDHGAGYCLIVPMQALQTALPLPPDLRNAWLVAGSDEQAALRRWLGRHRSRLVWERTSGQYELANT